MARGTGRDPDLRRANPRHRRGRAARHLPADQCGRRRRRWCDHDLLGSARSDRDERSRPRDARRSDRGGVLFGERDRRRGSACGARRGFVINDLPARPRWKAQRSRQIGTFAGLVVLCLVLWAATPHFLTVSNLLNVLEQTSINAIVAVGMTYVIISGGIDLSVGGVLAVGGLVRALALEGGLPAPVAIVLALATGTACGLANGVLITFGRLPPFIATLGMMSVARGAALMLAEGRPISGFSEGFRALATGRVLIVPAPVLL